jgi:prolyl oligopeptidase
MPTIFLSPTSVASKFALIALSFILFKGCTPIPQMSTDPIISKPSKKTKPSEQQTSRHQMDTKTAIEDPRIYLEEVSGEKAMNWVREQNAVSRKLLEAVPKFAERKEQVLAILNNRNQIPQVRRIGSHFYQFWRDAQNPAGLWRRATLDEFKKDNPAWETVLDVDQLAKTENENWVYKGAQCAPFPSARCMLALSRGGADASVYREFDLQTKQFVANGFFIPEAKTSIAWDSQDRLFVETDFGPGSLTASGYPRIVKLWQRATPLSQAITIFEGKVSDVSSFVMVERSQTKARTLIGRSIDFYTTQTFEWQSNAATPALKELPIPSDANVLFHENDLYLVLRSDLTIQGQIFKSGSLITSTFDAVQSSKPNYQLLFSPTPTRSLSRGDSGVQFTKDGLILTIQDNVANVVEERKRVNGQWISRAVSAPLNGTLSVTSLYDPQQTNDPLADQYFFRFTDFLTPPSLYLARFGTDQRSLLKQNPAFFEATGMRSEQRFARSPDGTSVPYFVVYPKNYVQGANHPTLLYGYGGFQISQQPFYSGGWGKTWYEQGGVLVLANIRGGGEFGPAWHQSALKENKQRSYDDFIAIAQDLIDKKIATSKQLGIMGGSNGGLLVGAVLLQKPELFGAVVCSVPLLDMRRYHLLLAGNSWMAEYGDPDQAEQWDYIRRYSPYQNVYSTQRYPRLLLTTSTRDDRVHPAHARKMAALLMSQGRGTDQVLYYENTEGGHAGAANNAQRADLVALEMSFLWSSLGGK